MQEEALTKESLTSLLIEAKRLTLKSYSPLSTSLEIAQRIKLLFRVRG